MGCACKLSSSLVKMMIRIDWAYVKQSHELISLFTSTIQNNKKNRIQNKKNTKYWSISFRQSLLLLLWNWYQFSMKHEINTLNVLVIPSQYRTNLSLLFAIQENQKSLGPSCVCLKSMRTCSNKRSHTTYTYFLNQMWINIPYAYSVLVNRECRTISI